MLKINSAKTANYLNDKNKTKKIPARLILLIFNFYNSQDLQKNRYFIFILTLNYIFNYKIGN